MQITNLGCSEGDIRLAEGPTRLEGRVEMCKNNMWGTVCSTYWGKPDARVVCRQLGLSVAGTVSNNSTSIALSAIIMFPSYFLICKVGQATFYVTYVTAI